MINPAKILQMKSAWETFSANHPKFLPFLRAVGQNGAKEGCIYEITVTTPEGQTLTTNLKLKEEDIELIRNLKDMI